MKNTLDSEIDSEETEEKKPVVIRNSTDLQRLKLERLMKNPDKLVVIPERQKEKDVPIVPDFVRNVMGSSAGAGSGEFHVYRHLRRKEYARQKFMKEKAEKEKLDDDYHNKLNDHKKQSEEKTAKKRLKRLKKKQKQKSNAKKQKSQQNTKPLDINEDSAESEQDGSSSEDNTTQINDKEMDQNLSN